jgi:hypothetical protein
MPIANPPKWHSSKEEEEECPSDPPELSFESEKKRMMTMMNLDRY